MVYIRDAPNCLFLLSAMLVCRDYTNWHADKEFPLLAPEIFGPWLQ